MTNKIQTVKIKGIDTVEVLNNIMNDIAKLMPDISFKPKNMNTWGVIKDEYPNGVCDEVYAFHSTDLNNHIGVLGVSNYSNNSDSHKPKYGITSINIQDGRNTYGSDGAYKYSIHSKNIVRIAKKVFKPFTFDQIANRCRREFKNSIDSLGNNMRWELRQNTCDGVEHLIADWENLYHLGYTPKNEKFKKMMQYVMDNKAKIDKYHNYNPEHYFVLVKDGEVQYRLNSAKDFGEPYIVPSKDDLPEDIRGKLFVLDITDKSTFVEEVGLKENDGAYWIIA